MIDEKNNAVQATVQALEQLVDSGEHEQLLQELTQKDFHEVVQILKLSKRRLAIFRLLPADLQAEVLAGSGYSTQRLLTRALTTEEVHAILHFVDPIEREMILSHRSAKERDMRVAEQVKEKVEDAAELIQVAPESAGNLVNDNYIIARDDYVVADVERKVEQYVAQNDDVPVIIVTDRKEKVLGRLYFAHIIAVDDDLPITSFLKPVLSVNHSIDQEFLIHMLKNSPDDDDLIVATNEDDQPIGVIHARTLLTVMEEEHTEDLYGFAGVNEEERVNEPVWTAVRHRYKWLLLNLVTALAASLVVTLFTDTINQLVILAAYMPVVAGMGGNAGTQTLAVVIRGIALGEIEPGMGRKVLFKEMMAGLIDGIIVGAVVATVATLFHGDPMLGVVLGVALIFNLITSGLFGTIVPLMLKRLNLDPAISSSVFLTTTTDIVGFFVFLGLASLMLL